MRAATAGERRLNPGLPAMDWRELDFVLLLPDCERTQPVEGNGWENVVFQLEDDEEDGNAE